MKSSKTYECNSKFQLSLFPKVQLSLLRRLELSAGVIKPIMFDLVLGNHFLGGFDQ
jgi:hypothetical protein